mgnify:CR=1 FL=1
MRITNLIILLLLISVIPLVQSSPQGKTSIKVFVAEKPNENLSVENLTYFNQEEIHLQLKEETNLIKKTIDKIKEFLNIK